MALSVRVHEWWWCQWKCWFNVTVEWLCKISWLWWNMRIAFNTLFWLLSIRFECKSWKERGPLQSLRYILWHARETKIRNLQLLLHYIVPIYYKGAPQYSWCNRAVTILLSWSRQMVTASVMTQRDVEKLCFILHLVWGRCIKFHSVHAICSQKSWGRNIQIKPPHSYRKTCQLCYP